MRALNEKGGTPAPTRDSSPSLGTGDKLSISAAELSESQALKVTNCMPSARLLFFDELIGVRWRRVRASAMAHAGLVFQKQVSKLSSVIFCDLPPPPPNCPPFLSSSGDARHQARGGAQGNRGRVFASQARAAARRARQRGSARASDRQRRRHEGGGAQGQYDRHSPGYIVAHRSSVSD